VAFVKIVVSLSLTSRPHMSSTCLPTQPPLSHEWTPFVRIFFFLLTVHRSALLHIRCSPPARPGQGADVLSTGEVDWTYSSASGKGAPRAAPAS